MGLRSPPAAVLGTCCLPCSAQQRVAPSAADSGARQAAGPSPALDSCSFVGAEMPRGRRFHWEVVVVEDKTPNAFVLPGGKIVVFTSAPPLAAQSLAASAGDGGHLLPPSTQLGTRCCTPSLREVLLLTRPGSAPSAGLLLPEQQNFLLLLLLLRKCVRRVRAGLIKLLDRDEDLLAAVLGHEVAHALARHSTEKLRCGSGFSQVSTGSLGEHCSWRCRWQGVRAGAGRVACEPEAHMIA